MSASYFREKARNALAGKWGNALLVALVASIFGALLTGSNFSLNYNIDEETMQMMPEIVLGYLAFAGSIGGVLGLAQFILGGVVQLGYCKYLLKQQDGEDGDVKDLFSEMDRFGDGFVLSLLTALYVALWTMLFIIPGIIAVYRYAMAPFILLENPGMRPKDAISESKQLMDGNKGDLFVLNLSFIGWSLLNILTLGIGSLWLNPYMNAAYAAFYRCLRPRVVLQPVVEEPKADEPVSQIQEPIFENEEAGFESEETVAEPGFESEETVFIRQE